MDPKKLEQISMAKAHIMITNGMVQDMDFFQLTDLLISMELEKEEKQNKLDSLIDFEDEILTIEEIGKLDTIDISVTGDQLFYCNGILTKNSMGLAHTADAIFALVTSEELDEMGQIMIKQLKNRWGDLSYYRKFVLGINRAKMKLFNLEESAQKNVTSSDMPQKSEPKKFQTYEKPDKPKNSKFNIGDLK